MFARVESMFDRSAVYRGHFLNRMCMIFVYELSAERCYFFKIQIKTLDSYRQEYIFSEVTIVCLFCLLKLVAKSSNVAEIRFSKSKSNEAQKTDIFPNSRV